MRRTKSIEYILVLGIVILQGNPFIVACTEPDCGDECYYWDWDTESCEFTDECVSWSDCGWACDCTGCSCDDSNWQLWCGEDYYTGCFYAGGWKGCECLCADVTQVTLSPAGPYYVGQEITMEATVSPETSGDCPIYWMYTTDRSNPVTVTLPYAVAGQRINAATDCGGSSGTLCYSDPYDVVGITRIEREKQWVWDGKFIGLTGIPNPEGVSFPDNKPEWEATNGTISGSGASVTWMAPFGMGSNTEVTATCGTESANIWVNNAYARLDTTNMELLRSESKPNNLYIEPVGAPITFSEDVPSELVRLYQQSSSSLACENQIAIDNINAHIDSVVLSVIGSLPDSEIKVIGDITFNLKKWLEDWWNAREFNIASELYTFAAEEASEEIGQRVRDDDLLAGFSSSIATARGNQAESAAMTVFGLISPSGFEIDTDKLDESTEWTWKMDVNVINQAGIEILDPEFSTIEQVVDYTNQYGWTSELILPAGVGLTFFVTKEGANHSNNTGYIYLEHSN